MAAWLRAGGDVDGVRCAQFPPPDAAAAGAAACVVPPVTRKTARRSPVRLDTNARASQSMPSDVALRAVSGRYADRPGGTRARGPVLGSSQSSSGRLDHHQTKRLRPLMGSTR